jgi:DNA-binding MarR family transcriptional regulator
MKVEDCIFFQLAKVNQAAQRFWGHKIAAHSVTPVQGMVLNALLDEDHITSRRLGERIQLDSATLTGVLDRLETLGFVERLPHPNDRRAILVCLTGRGKELTSEIRRNGAEANREFLDCLSSEEEKTLRSLLARVRGQQTN